MESLYLLIPISVLIILGVGVVFLRMAAQGQFDDLDSPATRILLDDDRTPALTRTAIERDQPVAHAIRTETAAPRHD